MKAQSFQAPVAAVLQLFSTPADAARLFLLAYRLDEKKESWSDAERLYREVVRIAPGHWEAWNNLGMMAYRFGRKAEALEAWGNGLLANPDGAELHNNIGHLFQQEKKFEIAAVYLRKAMRLNPDCEDTYVNLGLCLQALGRLQSAARCWTRYLHRWPGGDFADLARKNAALCQRR